MAYPLSFANTVEARAKYTVKSTDWNSIQMALPSIGANTTAEVFVPVTKRFSVKGFVDYSRPDGKTDPGAVSIAAIDCIAPAWPASTAVTNAQPTPNWIVVNGTAFQCTTAGTTAGTIPAGLTTQPAAGTTVTDGTAVWTSKGQRGAVIRIRFANSSAGALTPTTQTYEFYQF